MKMELTECSETSTHKFQTPGFHPKERLQRLLIFLIGKEKGQSYNADINELYQKNPSYKADICSAVQEVPFCHSTRKFIFICSVKRASLFQLTHSQEVSLRSFNINLTPAPTHP